MPANYVLLERIELAASAASVTFANLPQSGYTDLKVVMSIRGDAAQILLKIQPNGNTTGLSRRSLYTDTGTAAFSGSGSDAFGGYINSSAYTANTFASLEVYFPNYTSSTAKSYSVDVVGENNATTTIMGMIAGLDTTTSPISSLLFAPNSGNFVANSTFSLYGLAALGTTPAIAPKASGGNRIDYDGTYYYHVFNSTGAFVPQTGLSCDVLVVAGGGGGGYSIGGGGGAGGLLGFTSQSLTNTSYAVTVGGGGAGGTSTVGATGSDSQFSSLTLVKGGGGGGSYASNSQGQNGGSGGGNAVFQTTGPSSGTSGQGNAGGVGGGAYYSGGGGGAGAVGQNGVTSTKGGNGGNGSSAYSSWATATSTGVSGSYAGGGGGSGLVDGGSAPAVATGGTGGGGNGGTGFSGGVAPVAGVANTGGGGGGGQFTSGSTPQGGAGGSGIVIIRYLAA